jgi:hypothetical protein
MAPPLLKIISGGQTGADRAALDWALERGVPHGGWCPKGRWAEDGTIQSHYRLEETPSDSVDERTEWNVRDSDGTVILSIGEVLAGGSKLTLEIARRLNKPVIHLARSGSLLNPPMLLRCFIDQNQITVLNVAGSRVSKESEVGAFVRQVLDATFFYK